MGNINIKNYEVSNAVCKCIIYRKVCREILSFGNLSGSMQPTKKDHTLVAETAYPSQHSLLITIFTYVYELFVNALLVLPNRDLL